jgi:glycosyltransferase involved in cell wall biosynthesis
MRELLDLSVIIPTRNRPRILKQTIASACDGNGIPRQMIVVDQSDCPVREEDLIDVMPDGIQLVVLHREEPSLTAARNAGIRKAECSIVLFMDDDVLLDSESLTRLCRGFLDSSVALIAAPEAEGSAPGKRYPTLLSAFFLRKKPFARYGYICRGAVLGRYPDMLEEPVETEWAMGYFFAVRLELLKRFSVRFDERLESYAYPEDLDFSYAFIKRANREGFRAVLDPHIQVEHLGSKEWRIMSRKATYMYVIHRYYVSYKYFRGWWMRAMLGWSDVGVFFRRLLEREQPFEIVKAHLLCIKKRHILRLGIIDRDLRERM